MTTKHITDQYRILDRMNFTKDWWEALERVKPIRLPKDPVDWHRGRIYFWALDPSWRFKSVLCYKAHYAAVAWMRRPGPALRRGPGGLLLL
jgi:hypothetical protein